MGNQMIVKVNNLIGNPTWKYIDTAFLPITIPKLQLLFESIRFVLQSKCVGAKPLKKATKFVKRPNVSAKYASFPLRISSIKSSYYGKFLLYKN